MGRIAQLYVSGMEWNEAVFGQYAHTHRGNSSMNHQLGECVQQSCVPVEVDGRSIGSLVSLLFSFLSGLPCVVRLPQLLSQALFLLAVCLLGCLPVLSVCLAVGLLLLSVCLLSACLCCHVRLTIALVLVLHVCLFVLSCVTHACACACIVGLLGWALPPMKCANK